VGAVSDRSRPYDQVVDIHLNFSLTQEELRNPLLSEATFDDVVQIDAEEALAIIPGSSVKVLRGTVGKGASNWGVDVLLTVSMLANMDGLIDLGERALRLARKLTGGGTKRGLLVRDPPTVGVLAVGAYQPRSDLHGGVVVGSWCVTGGGPGIGFDGRDLWVTSVVKPDQSVILIVTSPDGIVLGSLNVPPRL
jgi:hypothetical protein